VNESHGFWLILAVENVKLEMPLLMEKNKEQKLIRDFNKEDRQQPTRTL